MLRVCVCVCVCLCKLQKVIFCDANPIFQLFFWHERQRCQIQIATIPFQSFTVSILNIEYSCPWSVVFIPIRIRGQLNRTVLFEGRDTLFHDPSNQPGDGLLG